MVSLKVDEWERIVCFWTCCAFGLQTRSIDWSASLYELARAYLLSVIQHIATRKARLCGDIQRRRFSANYSRPGCPPVWDRRRCEIAIFAPLRNRAPSVACWEVRRTRSRFSSRSSLLTIHRALQGWRWEFWLSSVMQGLPFSQQPLVSY